MKPTLIRITYDMDYIEEVKKKGLRGKRKAMAFFYYIHNLNIGHHKSMRHYAAIWGISKTTASKWIKVFNAVIDNADNYIV